MSKEFLLSPICCDEQRQAFTRSNRLRGGWMPMEKSLLEKGWVLVRIDNCGNVVESWSDCLGSAHHLLRLLGLTPDDKRVTLFQMLAPE